MGLSSWSKCLLINSSKVAVRSERVMVPGKWRLRHCGQLIISPHVRPHNVISGVYHQRGSVQGFRGCLYSGVELVACPEIREQSLATLPKMESAVAVQTKGLLVRL